MEKISIPMLSYKHTTLTTFVAFMMLFLVFPAQAEITITDCGGLNNVRNDTSGSYVVVQPIDCSGFAFNPIMDFTGTFDGGNHPITGVQIGTTDINVGLFGTTLSGAVIQNTRLEGVDISGGMNTGALVGNAVDTTIIHCSSSGSVVMISYQAAGGLIGRATGNTTIVDSSSSAEIIGCYDSGGLVGELYRSQLQRSFATGNIKVVSGCQEAWGVGGLVGYTISSSIDDSWASGAVTGTAAVGGLVGGHDSDRDVSSTIENSYATGDVTGHACGILGPEGGAGGLVGWLNSASISASFSTGTVSCLDEGPVGALVGSIETDGSLSPPSVINGAYFYNQGSPGNGIGYDETGLGHATSIADLIYFYNPTNPPLLSWGDIHWSYCPGSSFPHLVRENYDCPLPAEDADTDGILDASDNCVTVINPYQSDIDGDGAGDLCDTCPADDTNTCNIDGSAADEITASVGGTVLTPDGQLNISIDPGDLEGDTTISVTETTVDDPEVNLSIGTTLGTGQVVAFYELGPSGTQFTNPVMLTVKANVTSFNQFQRDTIDIYRLEDTNDDGIPDTFVALGSNCSVVEDPIGTFIANCTIDIDHFSIYSTIVPLDSDSDGVLDNFNGYVDACPDEDATGFDVDSDGCIDSFRGLVDLVNKLVIEEVISTTMENSLLSKVSNAEKSFGKENVCTAINELEAFQNQVDAQTGKKISAEAATQVKNYADSVALYLLSNLASGETCS